MVTWYLTLNPKPIWGLKCLWFIRTVKSLKSVCQLQKQTLHCPIQSSTCFSMNKSAKPWKEEPNCLLNIRLGKICMSRISRCIAVFNVAHSQQHNHVKEENFNSCGLPFPWQQRRKESDGRWESIMWQWCHGTTGSDHHHMSYVVPLLCLVPCILHIRVGFSVWEWLEVQVTHTNRVHAISKHISKNKLHTKQVITRIIAKTSIQHRKTINYHLAVWFYHLVVTRYK